MGCVCATKRPPRQRYASTLRGLVTDYNKPVPLQSISVDVVVHGFVADVAFELQYKNEEENPVEAAFIFPLDGEAAVYAFEGLMGGTRIEAQIREKKQEEEPTPKKKESPLLRLVSLQNVDGSWSLDSSLASLLGLSETKIMSKTPEQVAPNVWATVLAILWLHSSASEQRDEWELLEGKALNWLQATAGSQLADCVKTGNAVLGSSVSPQTLGL